MEGKKCPTQPNPTSAFTQFPNVLFEMNLSGAEFKIMAFMFSYQGDKYFSQSYLSQTLHIKSRDTINRAIKSLEKKNLIIVTRQDNYSTLLYDISPEFKIPYLQHKPKKSVRKSYRVSENQTGGVRKSDTINNNILKENIYNINIE
jgi:biotin operon repressor